jgi:hypothetical protein
MAQTSGNPVFISYSRKDSDIMWRITRFLRDQGITVWVDNEKLIPGTPIWEEEIEKAIKAASATIVIMSPDSKNSEWVRREISLADQYRKQIFPILVRGDEDSSITLRLITRQYVDLRENEVAGLNSLHAALSQYVRQFDISQEVKAEHLSEKPSVERVAIHPATEFIPSTRVTEQMLVSDTSLWSTFAWALAGAIGGLMYDGFGPVFAGASSGAIGGLITAMTLRKGKDSSIQKNMFMIALVWAISGAIGWLLGDSLTEVTGMLFGYAIFIAIALAFTLGVPRILTNWQSTAWILLSWAIGGGIGWSIGRYIQKNGIFESVTGWTVGYALGWAIAGFITMWQLRAWKHTT